MNNKFFKIAIIIVLSIIVIILALIFTISSNQNNELNNINQNGTVQTIKVKSVKDRNEFFTVVNCVDRYVAYLSMKDSDILYNYLDEGYRAKNSITKENVTSKIKTLDDPYKFKAKEMYVTNLSDTILQYFVYGTLTIEATEYEEGEEEFYISVKLDKANNTFSIIPNQYIDNMQVIE